MFDNIYKNKKVLITGHTGFKGSWLTIWLLSLGAKVIGISKDIPTTPALFEVLELEGKIQHHLLDIRDFNTLDEIINRERPDFIFHLAAQAIVSTSYLEPLETISSNVIGTSHVLESLRLSNHRCTAIIITSDKAYDNIEQILTIIFTVNGNNLKLAACSLQNIFFTPKYLATIPPIKSE